MRLAWAVTLAAVALLSVAVCPADAARRKYGKPVKQAPSHDTGMGGAAAVDSHGSARVVADPQKARDTNDRALKLAQSGKLMDALPIFIEAMSLAPGNSEFINNVGVTEMRLGRLDSAMDRFKEALRHDPQNQAAKENLKDLQDYLEKSGNGQQQQQQQQHTQQRPVPEESPLDVKPTPLPEPAQAAAGPQAAWNGKDELVELEHTIRPMPRIALDDWYKPENWKYRTGQSPFILTGITKQASWSKSRHSEWTPEYFASKFPSSMVDFYPHNMEKESVTPIFQSLPVALEELRNTKGLNGKFMKSMNTPNSTYIQWNMNLQEWNSLMSDLGPFPDMFVSESAWVDGALETAAETDNFQKATHWRMLLVGNRHAGMFNHWDILRSSSYQFQAQGRKLWHICAPSEWHKMYKAGDVNTFNPLYDNFPKFLGADCVMGVAQPGDVLWYPRDYWHHTYNVDDWNVAFTSTLADGYNADSLSTELESECRGQTRRLPSLAKETCRKLNSAFDFWKQAYTGEYRAVVSEEQRTKMLAVNKRVRRGKGVGSFESIGQCGVP